MNYDNKTLILNECYENIDEKKIARFIYIEKIYTLKIESSKLAHRILESDIICGVKCLKKIDLKWRPFRVYDENTGLHKVVKNIHHESARLYEIPDSIGNFIHLESIDFNGNRIKCIPYTISKLLNLKSLNISSNLLTQLPNEIDGLKNLMQLDVSSNIDLYQIPLSIFKLKKLLELNLGFIHKLDLLDPYIYKLNNLKYLNIESTSIIVLPDGVCSLKRLEYLNISNTDIDIIPLCINELHELNCFELENTKIESLDHIKYGFKKLKTLNLGNNNNLKKLPDFVFLSPNIVSLNCSKCQISEISDKIGSLDKLQDLNFAQNILLKNLPASIQGLRKLHTLNLYGCKSLSILDLTKKSLPLLENLDIGETGITNLKGLSNLRSLKVLGCFNTPIEIIGTWISNLENLIRLDLRLTRITQLASEIGYLKFLSVLKLNQLNKSLPDSFGNLENLTSLSVSFDKNVLGPLPESFRNLQKLESFEISQPGMGSIPIPVQYLKSLRTLVIRYSDLVYFPSNLDNLENLNVLDLLAIKISSDSIKNIITLSDKDLNNLYINDNPIVEDKANVAKIKALLPRTFVSI